MLGFLSIAERRRERLPETKWRDDPLPPLSVVISMLSGLFDLRRGLLPLWRPYSTGGREMSAEVWGVRNMSRGTVVSWETVRGGVSEEGRKERRRNVALVSDLTIHFYKDILSHSLHVTIKDCLEMRLRFVEV